MQCPHDGMPCSRKAFMLYMATLTRNHIKANCFSCYELAQKHNIKRRLTPDLVLFGIILIDLITSAKNDSPESMRPRSGIHTLLDKHN